MTASSSSVSDRNIEKTEVLHGAQNIIERTLHDFELITERLDSCIDVTGPSIIVSTRPIIDAYINLKRRGIKTRYITEITKENLEYCMRLMEIVGEVRHLAGVKGNFGVTEFCYVASATVQEASPLDEFIISTVKSFVEQQRYFFDMLWDKATPASQRIREIEKGLPSQFFDTVYDPKKILDLVVSLIESANNEVLFILPQETLNNHHTKILNAIEKARYVSNKKIDVKILVTSGKKLGKINESFDDLILARIRQLNLQMPITMSMLVVDKKMSLSFELGDNYSAETSKGRNNVKNDEPNESKYRTMGYGVHSNSISIALSYAVIFEILWHQMDLYEQIAEVYQSLLSRDKALQEFVDITAHEIRNPLQS
ncbi:MAG: hypothetical protein M3162_05825, partial [Thermoproteota archaeon]|nr:hypothetical protein [Thermoproteota archaeon]